MSNNLTEGDILANDFSSAAFLAAHYRTSSKPKKAKCATPEYVENLRRLNIHVPQGMCLAPNAFQNALDFAHHADAAYATGGRPGLDFFLRTHVIRSRGKGKARRFSSRAVLSHNKTNSAYVLAHAHTRENARRVRQRLLFLFGQHP